MEVLGGGDCVLGVFSQAVLWHVLEMWGKCNFLFEQYSLLGGVTPFLFGLSLLRLFP